MKKFILNIVLIILILPVGIKAQNLVYNGSFEIRDSIYQNSDQKYHNCPYRKGGGNDAYNPQLTMAKGWSNIPGKYQNLWYSTFDFYHSCGNDTSNLPLWISKSEVTVPSNTSYMEFQYPRTGEGFTAGGFYSVTPNFTINPSEYLNSKLQDILLKNTLYNLCFYVNLANSSRLSINSQGAYVSQIKPDYTFLYAGLLDSSIVPQLMNQNGYIEDTVGWVEVSGTFKAKGGEQFLTLGGMNILKGYEKLFNPNSAYDIAAYAIDDISLYPVSAPVDSARCGDDTLICLGNSLTLGKSQVKPEYRNEYSFEWYVSGREDSVFSYDEHPVVTPSKTTTYVVKVVDFKFDHTTDSITVTVVDCAEPTSLVVYPNPSFGEFNFSFNSPIPENIHIEVFDLTGRLLKTKYYEQDYENKEVKLNLKTHPAGMYLYSVVLNNERKFNGKLILIK